MGVILETWYRGPVDLKELRSLVTLAEVGSISMAAERLHLSPPAIHKQLINPIISIQTRPPGVRGLHIGCPA